MSSLLTGAREEEERTTDRRRSRMLVCVSVFLSSERAPLLISRCLLLEPVHRRTDGVRRSAFDLLADAVTVGYR